MYLLTKNSNDTFVGRILHDDATILPVVVPTHPVVVPTHPADTKEHDDTKEDLSHQEDLLSFRTEDDISLHYKEKIETDVSYWHRRC